MTKSVNLPIGEALQWAAQTLQNSEFADARIDARVLLQHVLKCDRTFLYTFPEKRLQSGQISAFKEAVNRRLFGEPVAYITGEKEFWGLSLTVNPSTLIPRADTEVLIELALETITDKHISVLDLGTGTGAIALALGSEKPDWQILGVDRVKEAVALAEHNRQRLGIGNVTFVRSNWFSAVQPKRYELIVSNPPYVESDSEYLGQGDLRFEPQSALTSHNEGMADIAKIIDIAPNFLANHGWLMIEHGYKQGPSVQRSMRKRGFKNVDTRSDLQQHPRVTFGCWSCENTLLGEHTT